MPLWSVHIGADGVGLSFGFWEDELGVAV
jgi:hypothetical protein